MKPQFEFATDYRGPCARLTWEKQVVILTEWPASLLAMLRVGVLGPNAKAEAEALQ